MSVVTFHSLEDVVGNTVDSGSVDHVVNLLQMALTGGPEADPSGALAAPISHMNDEDFSDVWPYSDSPSSSLASLAQTTAASIEVVTGFTSASRSTLPLLFPFFVLAARLCHVHAHVA